MGASWTLRLGAFDVKSGPDAGVAVRRLLHHAFGAGGAWTEGASLLLGVHDDMRRSRLSHEAVARWRDPAWRRYACELVRESISRSFETGYLTLQRDAEVRAASVPEAPDTLPDLPDVAPETESWFEARLVDEVGEVIANVDLAFSVGGERRIVRTDGAGIARLEGMTASRASVGIATSAQVRAAVESRWTKPRAPKIPEGPAVHVLQLDGDVAPVSIESEVPTTLAITPFFRCSELSGVHFEFGRSFVLSTGLRSLAMIAASLRTDDGRKALVFGHTDLAGEEDVNKELSERRARSLYALFTHDADDWEHLHSGTDDGNHWRETWGLKQIQHQLVALAIPDDEGNLLVEDGKDGTCTRAALKRFQRIDYEAPRAGRSVLPETGHADAATRRELFLSYASLVDTEPLPQDRFTRVGSRPFMGCGEYNPLSEAGTDEGSRRAVVFVFDAAAEPQALPCKLRSTSPCVSVGRVRAPLEPGEEGAAPYRCGVYRDIAKTCPCTPTEMLRVVALQLHDREYKPCGETAYRLKLESGTMLTGHTKADGTLLFVVPDGPFVHRLEVSYQAVGSEEESTLRASIYPEGDDSDEVYIARMKNLGFGTEADEPGAVIHRFQLANRDLRLTGTLDEETKAAVRRTDQQQLDSVLEASGKEASDG